MVILRRWSIWQTPAEVNLKDRKQRRTDGQQRGEQAERDLNALVLSILTFQSDAEAHMLSAGDTALVTLDIPPSLCFLDLSCGWQTKSYSHPDIPHKANVPRKYCKTQVFLKEKIVQDNFRLKLSADNLQRTHWVFLDSDCPPCLFLYLWDFSQSVMATVQSLCHHYSGALDEKRTEHDAVWCWNLTLVRDGASTVQSCHTFL